MVWHHQAKYSIWIGTACALWVFLALLLFTKPFSTCDVPLKVSSWRQFFSFRVGTLLILKVEIITWSCSVCFFFFVISAHAQAPKNQDTDHYSAERELNPTFSTSWINPFSPRLLWVQMLLPSVSGAVPIYDAASCPFLCVTRSLMVRLPFQRREMWIWVSIRFRRKGGICLRSWWVS